MSNHALNRDEVVKATSKLFLILAATFGKEVAIDIINGIKEELDQTDFSKGAPKAKEVAIAVFDLVQAVAPAIDHPAIDKIVDVTEELEDFLEGEQGGIKTMLHSLRDIFKANRALKEEKEEEDKTDLAVPQAPATTGEEAANTTGGANVVETGKKTTSPAAKKGS